MALPLANFEVVHSHDVDQARAIVGTAFCSHKLMPSDGTAPIDVRFHAARAVGVGLYYLDYGHDVRIVPDDLSDCYLIQIPLSGSARIRSRTAEVVSNVQVASVLEPDNRFEMDWARGNRQLIVRIDRESIEQHLHRTLGQPLGRRLRFELGMDLTDPRIRSWRSLVDLLYREFDSGGTIPVEPIAMREMQRLLMSQLLLAQPNTYSGAFAGPAERTVPRVIRRAADLIEAHAAEPLAVEDIAEAVDISVRALQDGFRRAFDTTPMNFLREVRLKKVHDELAAAGPRSVTVTDVAIRWGFLHAGRFSVQYRERFGESPSQTLRR
ncbi:AraC family transcriptional regulator [Skermania sp. ID1734]|uniref:AraC family transcriptional regulator n=1 Tax=Skermania sp. ID1734 TaxID=2597516 RepID=UPI0021047B62|nr:AraC family transcriptional regulator [Skermania sp. ID1734]